MYFDSDYFLLLGELPLSSAVVKLNHLDVSQILITTEFHWKAFYVLVVYFIFLTMLKEWLKEWFVI